RPTAAYRRHTYLAVAGVMLFLLAYASAALWFAVTAYRLFASVPHGTVGIVLRVGGGVASAFMALLMVKAAFFVRRGEIERDFEVTQASHPQLFKFLYR